MNYSITEIMLFFFVYAFLGWGCEVAFAACKEGKFVNRGFLNGPVCPIYGFGVIGVVVVLHPVYDNLVWLYLGSVVLTSLIEFITGFVLEKIFHARWWDYSDMPLNIMGYVCLLFSLLWGFACLVVVRWVHPLIVTGVQWLPGVVRIVLCCVFGAVFIADICATIVTIRRLTNRLRRLAELGQELHSISDEIGRGISDKALNARKHVQEGSENLEQKKAQLQLQWDQREAQISAWLEEQRVQKNERTESTRTRLEGVKARISQIMEEKGFGHKRLLNAFPKLRSHRNEEAMEALRRFYEKRRKTK